jgi:DnaJ-class molecular chaperone
MPNYYEILGVPRNASEKDVRQAYRRMAREYHPDVNRGDKSAEERFKKINEANSVLSDPDKRRRYDRYGDNWEHSDQIEEAEARARRGGTFRWFGDGSDDPFVTFGDGRGAIFDQVFADLGRGTRRSAGAEYAVSVTLEEANRGTTRLLELPRERRLEVKIPPGVDNGSRVHVAAETGQRGGIYLVISVQAHPRFQRQGRDLYSEVEVALEDAVLGGEITVPTLAGKVALTIPPETQNGQRFRLAGQGMPGLNDPSQRGDLYATVKVKLPTGLNQEQRALFLRLKESRTGKGG